MVSEAMMLKALDGQFTTYVGNPSYDDKTVRKRELLRQQVEKREQQQRTAREAKAQAEYEAARKANALANEPNPHFVLASVALAHGLPLEVMLGPSRVYGVKLARHHAAWELKKRKSSWSLIRIGHLLGRDHSTVINSLEYFDAHPDEFTKKVQIVQRLLTDTPK